MLAEVEQIKPEEAEEQDFGFEVAMPDPEPEKVRNPRGAGRKPKPRDAKEIWEREVVGLAELAQQARKMALEELTKIQRDSAGVTNLKQRLEIARTVVGLVDTLTKTAKLMLTEMAAKPSEEEKFDLEAFMRKEMIG